MEALLSSEVQHVHEQQRPRTARVNTLKMSVAGAVAWLSAPPPEHSCQPPQVPTMLYRQQECTHSKMPTDADSWSV